MTADTNGGPGATASSSGSSAGLPPGVVLGKDGKPCRTCSSGSAFKSFTSNLKATGTLAGAGLGAATTSTTTTATTTTAAAQPATDCPPDVEALGRSTWTLLHSIAATYPTAPSPSEQSDLRTFMSVFGRLYPCWTCAEDFREWTARRPAPTRSRDEFGVWLCEAHNEVNRKLGKEAFDCRRWEERWRTGWKDGRCD